MQKFIIYQLLLRVFGNRNNNTISNGSLLLNGSGKFSSIDDKTFAHLKSLNVTHIWLTGVIRHATCEDFSYYNIPKNNSSIVKGVAGSPYAIVDYYDVNPYLADNVANRMDEFKDLIDRCHKNDFKVIIDFVPNHLSREYKSICKPEHLPDFGEFDKKDGFYPDNNFYYLPNAQLKIGDYIENPARATGNDCFTATPSQNDWYETVKLNYGVDYASGTKHFNPIPRTWEMMYNILSFWANKGVDGFRCDMAEMVPVEFWGWVIPKIKRDFRGTLFIAEVYNPLMYADYINIGKFNYLYDKVGLYDSLKGITRGERSTSEIVSNWQQLDKLSSSMLNFLENHDEQRVASDFNIGDPFKAIPQLTISLLFNNRPFMLYFGQEIGERGMNAEGYSGVDGRTSIFDFCSLASINRLFNNQLKDDEKELLTIYKELLKMAMEPFYAYGSTYDLQYANLKNPDYKAATSFTFARRGRFNPANLLEKYDKISIISVDFTQSLTTQTIKIPKHLYLYWDMDMSRLDWSSITLNYNKYGISINHFNIENF